MLCAWRYIFTSLIHDVIKNSSYSLTIVDVASACLLLICGFGETEKKNKQIGVKSDEI